MPPRKILRIGFMQSYRSYIISAAIAMIILGGILTVAFFTYGRQRVGGEFAYYLDVFLFGIGVVIALCVYFAKARAYS